MYRCEYKEKCFCTEVFKMKIDFWAKSSRNKTVFDWRELLWSIKVHWCVYANKCTCLALTVFFLLQISPLPALAHIPLHWRKSCLNSRSPVEMLSLALLFCTVLVSWTLLLIFNGIHYPQWRKKDTMHWFLLVLWRIHLRMFMGFTYKNINY